jgi:5-methylcytosine-specific restriction protein A
MSHRSPSRRDDRRSAAAKKYHKWYCRKLWLRRAEAQLQAQPLCERHLRLGLLEPATVANHVIPHRGNWTLFSTGELESVCKACHDGPIQAEEAAGAVKGNDVSGRPLDPRHPWNRAA